MAVNSETDSHSASGHTETIVPQCCCLSSVLRAEYASQRQSMEAVFVALGTPWRTSRATLAVIALAMRRNCFAIDYDRSAATGVAFLLARPGTLQAVPVHQREKTRSDVDCEDSTVFNPSSILRCLCQRTPA